MRPSSIFKKAASRQSRQLRIDDVVLLHPSYTLAAALRCLEPNPGNSCGIPAGNRTAAASLSEEGLSGSTTREVTVQLVRRRPLGSERPGLLLVSSWLRA